MKVKKYYHYSKLYEILQIGSDCTIILKRSSGNDNLVYMVPFEDYFLKLTEAHIQTGHGVAIECYIAWKISGVSPEVLVMY